MCIFKSAKIKPDAPSLTKKYYHGRLVRTVNARDVEYIECEVIDNSNNIKQIKKQLQKELNSNQRNETEINKLQQLLLHEQQNKTFQMEPETKKVTVTCKVNKYTPKTTFRATTTQFPINIADAVTGHKLQGRTLNKMIVSSWESNFPNWQYTVLSRVKSLDDLYLLEPINEEKSYAASPHFKAFIKRIQTIEKKTINNSHITYIE